MTRTLALILCLLVALAFSLPALANRTDIVVMKNGDKVTGEVKSLLRGKLEFKTDSMGTIYIEWLDIEAVISQTGQSVELTNGQRFFGPLRKSDNTDMVSIETEQGLVGVGVMDVVAMYPVESSLWERLELSPRVGFSWDKASNVGKYNLGANARYRDPKHITTAGFSAELTTVEGDDDTSRSNASLTHIRFRPDKRFSGYFGNLESNDELGIDLRTLAGVGYGWIPIRSNNNWFMMMAGVDVNHEIPVEGDSETNLEAMGRVSYEYFRYSDPERSFDTSFTLFPSITDFGRWRADLNANMNFEFIDDFTLVFSIFANYDSDPISEDIESSKSDYGVSSSLEYKF